MASHAMLLKQYHFIFKLIFSWASGNNLRRLGHNLPEHGNVNSANSKLVWAITKQGNNAYLDSGTRTNASVISISSGKFQFANSLIIH